MSLDIYLKCKCCGRCAEESDSLNYTHNLNVMAQEAGIYSFVWRPEENGIETAGQMIEILEKGIKELKSNPEKYKAFNPSNGWGDYDSFILFLERYLKACIENPNDKIEASR